VVVTKLVLQILSAFQIKDRPIHQAIRIRLRSIMGESDLYR